MSVVELIERHLNPNKATDSQSAIHFENRELWLENMLEDRVANIAIYRAIFIWKVMQVVMFINERPMIKFIKCNPIRTVLLPPRPDLDLPGKVLHDSSKFTSLDIPSHGSPWSIGHRHADKFETADLK